jgi:hypothetical protein
MIGDSLQLPVPRFSLLPITFPSLVHSHFAKKVKDTPVVYVVRDGRDVFVSHYFKALYAVKHGSPAQRKRALQLHRSLNESGLSLATEDSMRAFYEEWKRRPVGSRVNWGLHVQMWLKEKLPNVYVVRYEDMLENPHETLKKLVKKLSDEEVGEDVIEFSVMRNSFEYKTGRKPGDAKANDNRRSGSSGGWRNSLPDDLKDQFLADFGDVLDLIVKQE